MSTTPILALDMATHLGWAVRLADGEIRHGHQPLKASRHGKACARTRVRALEEFLPRLLRHVGWGRGVVVYEDVPRHSGPGAFNAFRVAFHLESILHSLCGAFLIPHESVESVNVSTLKKWTTGNGRASKADMVEAVQLRGYGDVTDHNEADALALLLRRIEGDDRG